MERLEHAAFGRPPGRLGGLPLLWCRFLRTRNERSVVSGLGFPMFLADIWGLESATELPAAIQARLAKRLP
jgi:hypothetical protein